MFTSDELKDIGTACFVLKQKNLNEYYKLPVGSIAGGRSKTLAERYNALGEKALKLYKELNDVTQDQVR